MAVGCLIPLAGLSEEWVPHDGIRWLGCDICMLEDERGKVGSVHER